MCSISSKTAFLSSARYSFEKFNFKTSGPIIAENGGIVVNQRTGEEIVIGNPEKAKEAFAVIIEEARDLVEKIPENPQGKFARRTDVIVIGRMEAIKLLKKSFQIET